METLLPKTSYAPDEELVEKIKQGETALFEVLIRRYNPLLYKIARSYGFLHHDAEDLLQETHYTAFMYLASFRQEASYKTWLTKIHLSRCYHKMNSAHNKHETAAGNSMDNETNILHTSADSRETEKSVLNRELASVLEKSLQQLPPLYRTVFVLREVEGFSVAETAELLGITPVNVKVRVNRAKALLQKQLETVYSAADLYEFHFKYCDKIVNHVFERIAATQS